MRRWLDIGLLLLGVHLAVTLVARQVAVARAVGTGRLMPAAGGPILTLGIQFHRGLEQRFLAVYAELLAALDPETRVLVVVSDEAGRLLFDRELRRRVETLPPITYAETGHPITSWARDRMAVLLPARPGAPSTLVAPPEPMSGFAARVNDWRVPWTVRRALGAGARIIQAPFQFEGGDLIADESHVFVATPLLRRNTEPEGVVAQVEALTGLEAVPILGEVPNHHIGMFVTPIGEGKVLWGSPALAAEVLGDVSTLDVGGLPLRVKLDERARFENVESALARAGLETVALPLVPTDQDHVMLSYDNALMERRDGRLHVYMPTYGVDALDAAARRVYEAEGALVHPIRVDGIFRLGGTVHCLTVPLERGDAEVLAQNAQR